jgi:hypothetical protein
MLFMYTKTLRVPALLVCATFIVGCEKTATESKTEIREAEFTSMSSCLAGLKKQTRLTPFKVFTDTPSKVTGHMSNSMTFACEVKNTGTKGRYVRGWYVVLDR